MEASVMERGWHRNPGGGQIRKEAWAGDDFIRFTNDVKIKKLIFYVRIREYSRVHVSTVEKAGLEYVKR